MKTAVFAPFLLAGLLFGLLAACGGGAGTAESSAPTQTLTQVSAADVSSNATDTGVGAASNPTSPVTTTGTPATTNGSDTQTPVTTTPPAVPPPTIEGTVTLPAAQNNPVTYFHILSTGQSLALGELSLPALSTEQPYNNLMLSPGLLGETGPMRPLVEALGMDALRESPSAGMANSLRAADPLGRPVVVGLHAQSGVPYEYLKKGGVGKSFAQGMAQAQATKRIVELAGHRYQPLAVTVVHGEADFAGQAGLRYEGYLKEWQADYEAEINSLTVSNRVLPMFINQMNTGAFGDIAVAQYLAHKNNPGKVILVGPKYQYNYGPDRLHLTNIQSKHMGEMFAKVIRKVAIEGSTWNPLMPRSVRRTGNIVTIDFAIPVGTLRLDTTTVALRPNYGFDFVQSGGTSDVIIQSVALVGGDTQIQLTLSGVPNGTNQRIRYAWKCNGGGLGFQACGRASDGTHVGGNVRDSDVSVSSAIGATGLPLHNWLVTFEEAVVSAP